MTLTGQPASLLGLDTLYIPGTIEYTRASWLAAHPSDPLPPFDPTQDVRSYQSPTSPFLTLDFSNGGCQFQTNAPITANGGLPNLPNDNTVVFPPWNNSPTSPATYQEPGLPSPTFMNGAQLCSEADAAALVAQLAANGFTVSKIDATDTYFGAAVIAMNGETRGVWEVSVNGENLIAAQLLAQMYVQGVGKPGAWSLIEGTLQWGFTTVDPSTLPVLTMPCNPLGPNQAFYKGLAGWEIGVWPDPLPPVPPAGSPYGDYDRALLQAVYGKLTS